jgi:hypothetical protein
MLLGWGSISVASLMICSMRLDLDRILVLLYMPDVFRARLSFTGQRKLESFLGV